MKRNLLSLALLLSALQPLCAQTIIVDNPFAAQNPTEASFRGQPLGSGRKTFEFRFAARNRMVLELSALQQIDSLPRLDSLVALCWQALARTGDTAEAGLSTKRVDAVFTANDLRIRTQTFPQTGEVFRFQGSDVTQLKVEQDTLTLRLFTRRGSSFPSLLGYRVSFLVNHLSDVTKLAAQPGLATALQQLRSDLEPVKKEKAGDLFLSKYSAIYDAQSGRRLVPQKGGLRQVGRQNSFEPYVHVGLQYVYGAWLPSAGAGLAWKRRFNERTESRYALVWEPHFVPDPSKGTRLLRNDFLTFRWREFSEFTSGSKTVRFVQNFSAGYLVHRSGTFFQANTFKFSLPGLEAKNLLLEPEFFFNDFFKNFSPSVKLLLYLE